MKITTVLATTAAAAGIGVLSAPIALADNPTPNLVTLGQPAELINGSVVQAWTISGLKPSSRERLSARALAGWRGAVERHRAPRGVKNEDIIIPSTKNCTVSEANEQVKRE